jgi:hypothetical protein
MSRAVQDLMAQKGMQSVPPTAQPEVASPEAANPEVAPPAEPEAEPSAPTITAPKDIKQALDRLAAKDALYQQERNRARQAELRAAEVEKTHQDFLARFSEDPMAVMRERNVRFSDIAMRALAGKDQPKQDPKDVPGLPAEAKAELDELRAFAKEYRETQQRTQHEAARSNQIALVKGVLEKDTQIPLVNELGKYGDVLDLVAKHVGQHGAFADDREAEEVVAFYARQVEAAERRTVLAYASKPGVKTWLAKELGLSSSPTQREAPPARPEIQGDPRETNPRPALSNNLTSQRTTVSPPQAWDYDAALRQTTAEMQAARNANGAGS